MREGRRGSGSGGGGGMESDGGLSGEGRNDAEKSDAGAGIEA